MTFLIVLLLLSACTTTNKRLIDSRSYQIGCVLGAAKFTTGLNQEKVNKITEWCKQEETKTRDGVGE